ncbi:uncharacterized protein BYT42DRAFT_559935 [Radiomyces spectabilis]|uniref:uncharacterized protein n=1 Tax=Radiomyces spectabilis TaxID=64574 RepID=UPI00221EF6A7|nr:uncharacterized protein BYT42DRAFT_559935 [Radiomyces spectabilis]KAI8388395.1 hypothetical protein BYT42DRAFT_559935 [Radiomyces spectabilis]
MDQRPNSATNSDDFVLQMEPSGTAEASRESPSSSDTANNSTRENYESDVCYPFSIQHPLDTTNATVQSDVMQSYIENYREPEPARPEPQLQRQLTAKLDDLLDFDEKHSTSRSFSLHPEHKQDPTKLPFTAERYTFYSAELGSLKSSSLHDLLTHTVVYNEKASSRTVADVLMNTQSWWIDILGPTNQEMKTLSKIFRIHPLTAEDIQAQESREKCEIFQNYMFISFRSFNHDMNSPDYLEAVNFYIIVFSDGVLTFRFQPLPHPHNVRRRIHQLKDFIHVTPEWINYALIDNITDSFAPLIQQTELEVDSIDDLVLVLNGSEQTDMLRRLGSCRKVVMQLLRLLGPKADVVRSLIKRYDDKAKEINHRLRIKANAPQEFEDGKVHHEVMLYLGDIQDHILTMLQNVTHYDLILGRAHRNYLGQISIELSQSGNTTNEVINRLTFLATIIVPLNLVASIFGMNVMVPGQNENDLIWFFWILAGMAMYAVAMIAFGRRAGFL